MSKIERAGVKKRAGTPRQTTIIKPTTKKEGITGATPGVVTHLTGVLFGPPKTGKTTLACSGRNVLLISLDPQGESTETLVGRDDILVVRPRDQDEIDELIVNLRTIDKGRFDWIVLDSLTFLMFMLGGEDITKAFKAGTDVRRAYGKAGAAVQQIVHDLVMLEQNIIFTAHLEKVSTEDENGVPLETMLGENEVKIAVSPMVWRILGAAVSFQGRTFKETVYDRDPKTKKRNKRTRYAVSFNDGDRSPAGSRLPMKGEYEITGSTLKELADELIQGG